jgi:hypothetical protein
MAQPCCNHRASRRSAVIAGGISNLVLSFIPYIRTVTVLNLKGTNFYKSDDFCRDLLRVVPVLPECRTRKTPLYAVRLCRHSKAL